MTVEQKFKQKAFMGKGGVQNIRLHDALEVLREEMHFLNEKGLLEILASFVHKQWSHWINYQDSKREIPPFRSNEMERWLVQARTPYSKLTEKEKESDREWARKILGILKVQLVFEKERWNSEQNHKKLRKHKK